MIRQQRVATAGKRFTLLKFRSMHTNAEERQQVLLRNNSSRGVALNAEVVRRFERSYLVDK